MVTLPSAQTVPQLTAGMYKILNTTTSFDLVAKDVDDFVRIATSIGEDRELRGRVAEDICSAKERVYSDTKVVKEFEDVVKKLVGGG